MTSEGTTSEGEIAVVHFTGRVAEGKDEGEVFDGIREIVTGTTRFADDGAI